MPRFSNQLLDLLPQQGRSRLLSLADSVHLARGQLLGEAEQTIRHVYFPTQAFISLIVVIEPAHSLELGLVGREGMVGMALALGVEKSACRAVVQGDGACWRLSAPDFQRELARTPALRKLLQRYAHVRMSQLATTTACTHFHRIGQRLARWLLMTHDRAGSDSFHVTHECMALMLGVRRVGVTNAAHELQRLGAITYHRGEVTVCDRARLEAAACACYVASVRAHEDLMRGRRGRTVR